MTMACHLAGLWHPGAQGAGYDGYTPGLIKYDIKSGGKVLEYVDFVPGSPATCMMSA